LPNESWPSTRANKASRGCESARGADGRATPFPNEGVSFLRIHRVVSPVSPSCPGSSVSSASRETSGERSSTSRTNRVGGSRRVRPSTRRPKWCARDVIDVSEVSTTDSATSVHQPATRTERERPRVTQS
jgi:hypothetical protein